MRARPLALFLACLLVLSTQGRAAAPQWLTKVADATSEARRTGHPILVDLYASWCGWCKELDRNVYSSPGFQQFARDYVLLRVDTEDGGEGTALDERFEVESLPTTLLLDADQVLLGKIEGYAPTEEYVAQVKSQLEEYRSYEQRAQSALAGKELRVQKIAAAEAHMRGDGKRAAALYRKIELSGDVPKDALGGLQYMLADALRLSRDWSGALGALERARQQARRVGDADLVERADLLAVNIAQESGDCKGAKDTLERFLQQHPESGLASQAKRALHELESDKSPQCT